jgi:amino acid transporter
MMGSGIIMLPTNMAKVGAISLTSWTVAALGSMAMAWGYAQAGIHNQRPGGPAAYAQDAYARPATSRRSFSISCRSRSPARTTRRRVDRL